MKSLRCICGHVVTAEDEEALFAEVERHLDEMLTHARLLDRRSAVSARFAADHAPSNQTRDTTTEVE